MIKNKVKNCISSFCQKHNINDYIGIIAYGSYVGGRSNDLSDLDIMIIKDNYDTQDCGSSMVDGVRVEYFIQDLKRLYLLIKREVDNNDPSHLTKFATCEIVDDEDGRVKEFIDFAKELYNKKINPSFSDADRFSIFSTHNRIEDLESLLNDDSFYSVYYITLEKIRALYSRINGIIDLPVMKIEQLYTNAEYAKKYISSPTHNLPDQEFINRYLECLRINDRDVMLKNIKALYLYAFGSLGFDASNFNLKFTQDAPFRV